MIKRVLVFCMMLTALALATMSVAFALTGAIGNARMVLKEEISREIQKSILVKNVNGVPVTINLSASGELEDYIKILDDNFVLQPGEEKKAYFTIEAKKPGTYESKIDVKFTPEEGNGVGLSSVIILIAYKEGQLPDSIDSNEDATDNTEEAIDGNEKSNSDEDITGQVVDNNSSKISPAFSLLLIMPILLVVLLILLSRKIKKRGEKGGKNLKLNSKKEMRHR